MNKLALLMIGFLLLVTGFYFVLDSGRMHPIETNIDPKDESPEFIVNTKSLDPLSISSKGNLGMCSGMLCFDGGIRLGP